MILKKLLMIGVSPMNIIMRMVIFVLMSPLMILTNGLTVAMIYGMRLMMYVMNGARV